MRLVARESILVRGLFVSLRSDGWEGEMRVAVCFVPNLSGRIWLRAEVMGAVMDWVLGFLVSMGEVGVFGFWIGFDDDDSLGG